MRDKLPVIPDDLKNALERYFSDPIPDSGFATWLEHELCSKLIEQEKKNMFGRKSRVSPRLAWGLGLVLTALLIGLLVTSPVVVTAMKRLLGYIPGVGLVEQGSHLRVLAEPVSQTRNGVTITVTEAVITVDRTVVVFTVENIPLERLPGPRPQEDISACPLSSGMRLPDGTQLQITGGNGDGWETGYENRFSYPALPADVNEATLLVPCIQNFPPGVLPENWELTIRFVPAPSDMTIMPVLEASPAPSMPNNAQPAEPNPIFISSVIDTGDSFILIGAFNPPAPVGIDEWSTHTISMKITDAIGREILYKYPNDIDLPLPTDTHSEIWAVEVSKDFELPLTIHYTAAYYLNDPQATFSFEFNAGSNPQPNQTWELNKDIQMAGHTIILETISIQPSHRGYRFDFASPDGSVSSVEVSIDGYLPQGGGGGGGGNDRAVNFSVVLDYLELPTGQLNIALSNLQVYGETREWSLDWTPDISP